MSGWDWVRRSRRLAWLPVLALSLAVGGCEYDRSAQLSKQDYEALLKRQAQPQLVKPEPPIPELQPVLAAPSPVTPAEERLVTVSVTETVPLKDLLQELARKADIDLELDPDIRGGIIFSARERPLREVIERIADLGGLRYSLKDGVLRVGPDRLQYETYRLDALNMSRNAISSISTSTDVFQVVGGGQAGHGNGSTSQVTTEAKANLWAEINTTLTQILANTNPQALAALRPPPEETTLTVTGAPAEPAPPPEAPIPPLPDQAGQPDDAQARAMTDLANAVNAATAQRAPAPPPPLQTGAPPAPIPGAPVAAAGNGSTVAGGVTLTRGPAPAAPPPAPTGPISAYFTANPQAGLISVYGTSRQHKLVKQYLDLVKARVSQQVLIEAKVLEVTLRDEFRAGINWRSLGSAGLEFAMPFGGALNALPIVEPPFTTPTTAPADFVTLAYQGGDISGLVNLVKRFGTIRTLSSPRLTAQNNQAAVLKVAENRVYFTLEVETTVTEGVSRTTVESELHTVPIGLVMTVLPVISEAGDRVTLSLRPTVTRIVDEVQDPAVAFQNVQGVTSAVPVVEIREMDSVVAIPSGNVVVMGGLMQERQGKSEDGVPGAMDVPLAGNLFKAQADNTQLTELVILLQATVVNGSDSVSPADRDLFRKFFNDPRPVAF